MLIIVFNKNKKCFLKKINLKIIEYFVIYCCFELKLIFYLFNIIIEIFKDNFKFVKFI